MLKFQLSFFLHKNPTHGISSLVEVKACCFLANKPWPKPMMTPDQWHQIVSPGNCGIIFKISTFSLSRNFFYSLLFISAIVPCSWWAEDTDPVCIHAIMCQNWASICSMLAASGQFGSGSGTLWHADRKLNFVIEKKIITWDPAEMSWLLTLNSFPCQWVSVLTWHAWVTPQVNINLSHVPIPQVYKPQSIILDCYTLPARHLEDCQRDRRYDLQLNGMWLFCLNTEWEMHIVAVDYK